MPLSNHGPVVCQVESLQRQFAQVPGLPFADLLPADLLQKLLAEQDIEWRERDYPPLITLAVFLSQCQDADPSLRQAVARRSAQQAVQDERQSSSNTGAYSRARKRLPENIIADLTRHIGKELMHDAPPPWSWHGRQVKVVDGSTVSMPDTGRKVRTRTITIATTLLDEDEYRKADLAALYRMRWQAELNLRSLKTVLQMDVLRCKSPAMVHKEFWAHLLAYNLLRKVMAQAAQKYQVEPWTIRFKATQQTMNAFALPLLTCAKSELARIVDSLLLAIARHSVGNRPDRVEPRKVKRRPKPYGLLTTPREKARKVETTKGCG